MMQDRDHSEKNIFNARDLDPIGICESFSMPLVSSTPPLPNFFFKIWKKIRKKGIPPENKIQALN